MLLILINNRRPAGWPSFCKSGASSPLLNRLRGLWFPLSKSAPSKTAILPFSLILSRMHKILSSTLQDQQRSDMFGDRPKMDKLYHADTNEVYLRKIKLLPVSARLHSSMLPLQLRNTHGQYACSNACHHVEHKAGFCSVQLKLSSSKLQVTAACAGSELQLVCPLSTGIQHATGSLKLHV